jgi:peptidoglycan/LPS O-acetylase OafA/YrhL
MTQTARSVPTPTPVPPATGGRMIQLDVLRGVAILLVLARHAVVPWSMAGPFRPITLTLWRFGWTGVDLFFVLSGFLIGGLLFNEIKKTNHLDVKRFLIRRGFKIWPAYFVYIAFVFCVIAHQAGWRQSFHAVLPNLLHVQNYLGTPRGQTWSLAIEEHFYLALPLFLLLLLALGRRRGSILVGVPATAAFLIVVCTSLRFIFNGHHAFHMFPDQTATHLRIDSLFFGVLLAYGYHLRPDLMRRLARHRLALLIVGLLLISPMALHDLSERPYIWTIGFTMLYVGYGLILIAFVYTNPGEGLAGKLILSGPSRTVAWIGLFSYSIYLWQFDLAVNPVEAWVLPHLPHHPATLFWALGSAIYLLVAVVTGVILSKLVEMPVLALRERLFPRRQRAVPMPPARAMTEAVVPAELGPSATIGSEIP